MAEEIGNAVSAPASVVGHGTVWQLRADRWSAIADLARRLADPTAATPAHEERARELGGLLDLVSPLEHYWAAPGPSASLNCACCTRPATTRRWSRPSSRSPGAWSGTHRPASGNDRPSRCCS